MDELIKLVSAKVGIPEPAARKAILVILGYFRQRLPAPLYYQLESILTGGGTRDLSNPLGGNMV